MSQENPPMFSFYDRKLHNFPLECYEYQDDFTNYVKVTKLSPWNADKLWNGTKLARRLS